MSVRIIRPPELGRWENGFRDLPDDMISEGLVMWETPVEILFDRSQQYVHVLSSDLKASGRTEIRVEGRSIVGEVIYGGTPEVDYAIYEHERGGDHAFLTRAFQDSLPLMEATMPETFERAVERWA